MATNKAGIRAVLNKGNHPPAIVILFLHPAGF